MINNRKRLCIASDTGVCESILVEANDAKQTFIDAIDDKTVDTILFRRPFVTIFSGKTRKNVNFSSLKIKHMAISKEKANGFLVMYGMENGLKVLDALKEEKRISISVIRKLNPNSLFDNQNEWEMSSVDEGEDFNVTTLRNVISGEVEIVVHTMKGE